MTIIPQWIGERVALEEVVLARRTSAIRVRNDALRERSGRPGD